MSAALPSKRPRPRPRAFHKSTSASGSIQSACPGNQDVGLDASQVAPPNPAILDPNLGVKREGSPGFEAIRAPPAEARASSASLFSDRIPPAPPAQARPAGQDDDDDFFIRSRRRTSSQEPSGTQVGGAKGKGRAFSGLDHLPEATDILNGNPIGAVLDDDDDLSDDASSSDSHGSAAEDSPPKRRRLKNPGEDHKRDKGAAGTQMPEWTKSRGRKMKQPNPTSEPAPIPITIDDSDEEVDVKKKGKAAKAEKELDSKTRARMSLTPPPDARMYNKSEWSTYIAQAVHGTDSPQVVEDDDDPIFAQLRAQDEGFEIAGISLNPNLAKLLGGTSAARARQQEQQRRVAAATAAAAAKRKGKERVVDDAEEKGSAQNGKSYASRSAGAANGEPISIDDDSDGEARPPPSKASCADPSDGGESDDSVQLLPRAPPNDRHRNSLNAGASPPRRYRMSSGDARVATGSAANGDGDDDDVRAAAPSSSQIESVHELLADPPGAGDIVPDVSVDLRPQTPVVQRIPISVQGKGGLKLKLKLQHTTKISTMLEAVTDRARRKNLLPAGSTVKLIFDGEVLNPNATIEDLEMESDDQVEAVW
ncbi:hypothetical protein OC844_005629 [Tilletia horrida]|nr:hypothetical protein OC844_005629 [Tilletia horrida]